MSCVIVTDVYYKTILFYIITRYYMYIDIFMSPRKININYEELK